MRQFLPVLTLAAALTLAWNISAQPVTDKVLPGHVPAVVSRLSASGRLPETNKLSLGIGLPLRNREELELLLSELYNPVSPSFHQFLTTEEFTRRFGPSEQEYTAVKEFARTNGFVVTGIHTNRVVLDVDATVADVERALRLTLRTYRHPKEARDFFAPDREPSVTGTLPVVTIEGLSDYGLPRPQSRRIDPRAARPMGGSGPSGYLAGQDFRNAYAPGTTLTGAGQTVGLLEFSAFFPSDITRYEDTIGLTNHVPLNTVVIGHPGPTTANNAEVALDIELAIAMAPGLAQVIVYEIKSVNPSSILSRMANDNLAKQLSSSWTWTGGPSTTVDNLFLQMAAQGQSFFQASGDIDAYTGSQALDNSSQTTAPVDSTNITCVGGTSLTMTGAGVSWSSETVWNYAAAGGANANVGSGGGISAHYTIPPWQTNVSMAANFGSTTFRNIPDVALTADSVYVAYNSGSSGGFAGTSCAAPLWAGFCALVNQQSVAAGGRTVGFLNPALYAIAHGSNYVNCFHDITTGNNVGTNSPGLFPAVAGYDLCTGLGTPNGTNLINALAPSAPYFLSQPVSRNVSNGANVTLSATAVGSPSLVYFWQFQGTNLAAGGNVSGVASSVLSIASATSNNSGSYRLLVTNNFGSATSSVAVLNVVPPPGIAGSITNRTLECGNNLVALSVTASGTPPFAYQWSFDAVPVAGATNASFSLTNLHRPDHSIAVTVSNPYGSVTSNALLTVLDTLAPALSITGSSLLSVELGHAFVDPGATASDVCAGAVAVIASGAVNTNAVGTNTLTYSAADGQGNTAITTRTVIVRDTSPPRILWSFTNFVLTLDTNCSAQMPDVTGTNFIVASDLSGVLTITQTPTNHSAVPLGTNPVIIAVEDASGNAAFVTNIVTVQEGTAPLLVTQPQSQGVPAGSSASFNVAATACSPLGYQWIFNGAMLAGQTKSALVLTNVDASVAGGYAVIVSASGGAITSAVATLTVNLLASSVALASSSTPAGYQDSLIFTAVVTPAGVEGAIQFSTNGVVFDTEPLVAGEALSTNISSLPRGTNLITAAYSGDPGHLSSTGLLAQIITNHPPSAAPAFFTNTSSLSLNIPIAALAASWADLDGDPVFLAGLETSSNGITLTDDGVALIYSNTKNLADQFICVIADGWGGTNLQTVAIAAAPLPGMAARITGIARAADGNFGLSLSGSPGFTYILEAALELSLTGSWQPIGTNTLDATGIWQFNDGQATNCWQRFYRLRLAP